MKLEKLGVPIERDGTNLGRRTTISKANPINCNRQSRKRARTSTNNTYEESTTDNTEEEIYTLGGQK